MTRLTLDSVNFGAVSATRWPHLIGYLNGHVSAWSAEEIAETRASGRLLAVVDVLGNSPLSASVLDFERGDVQSPTVVRAWLQARNQYRGDGTVYCSARDIPTVVSGLRGEKCNLWVADPTADGEPPFDLPDYPGLPAGVRVIARQFVLAPRSGGQYDLSVFYADDWHPEQEAPEVLSAARLAAAPELGHYAAAAADISAPVPGWQSSATGERLLSPPDDPAADPLFTDPKAPDPSPAGTTSSGPLSVSGPGPTTSSGPEPGELISSTTAAAAADTGAPAPELGTPVIRDDGTAAFAGRSVAGGALADPLFAEHELAASRRAVFGSSASSPGQGLNHDFIKSTLHDIGDVAAMFRRGGWASTAAELERVAGIAWEIGSALKAGGF